MTVLPVIGRELRAQSRSKFTYLMRVLAATAAIVVCAAGFFFDFIMWGKMTTVHGSQLFAALHATLFISIWVLVPLSAADCISYERREGTLSLLFLTPLSSSGIVLAKGLVHGLRAFSLWLAVLPVMTIAFLIGGVAWKELIASMMINFTAICLALAAGVLASSCAKGWGYSLVLATGLAASLFYVQAIVTGLLTQALMFGRMAGPLGMNNWITSPSAYGFFTLGNFQISWTQLISHRNHSGFSLWLMILALVMVSSGLMLSLVIQLAAWNMRRVWHEEPPSARQVWLEKKMLTPVIGVKFLRRWLRRKLDHNPVGWLEQRSWTGRVVTWGWFAVMISFYTVGFRANNLMGVLSRMQILMPIGILVVMSGVACGSFQREKETRVLELLLISPMKAREIIGGRVRGLWSQFLPCVILAVLVAVSFPEALMSVRLGAFIYLCASYFLLPLTGLFYSLRTSNFISAFLCTLLAGLILPVVLPSAILVALGLSARWLNNGWLYDFLEPFLNSDFLPVFLQFVIGFLVCKKLHRSLVRRDFNFIKTTT